VFALDVMHDPEAIERLAARDLAAAAQAFKEQLRPLPPPAADWPELLAHDLQRDGQLRLQSWAQRHGLTPATLSRGFRQVFATTPAAFRAELKTRAALALIAGGAASLALVAASTGFADQAHMTRAVGALTGHPPRYWRAAGGAPAGLRVS
jgi:AraC-like DNA-binding protein